MGVPPRSLIPRGRIPPQTLLYARVLHEDADPPTADFSHVVNSADYTVAFTDTSTGDGGATIVAWAWAFGDGGTSTSQNPSHGYATSGVKDAALTVTDSNGLQATIHHNVTVVAQRQFPTTLAWWQRVFPTLPVPIGLWPVDEAASPLVGRIAGNNFVQNQAFLYQQPGDTEPTLNPRYSIEFDTASTNEFTGVSGDTTFGDIPANGTRFMLVRFANPDNAATARSIAGKGSGAALTRWGLQLVATTGVLRAVVGDGTNSAQANSAAAYDDGNYHDCAYGVTAGDDTVQVTVDAAATVSAALGAGLATTLDTGIAPAASLRLGAAVGLSPTAGLNISYVALFDVPFTAAHLATFRALP